VSKPYALIVEDDKDISRLIDFHLGRGGFRTHSVESGKEALEHVGRDKPDVVLLDIMLPDVDGLTICHEMREDPRTADLPIVMVSARGEEEDIVAGLELGADDYISKPFSPNVLLARVRAVMRRSVDSEPSRITFKCWAQASKIWQVPSRSAFDELNDLHPWAKPQIDMRFNYKPDRPLYLVALRTCQWPAARTLPFKAAYAGCKSWVPLDDAIDTSGATPAMDESRLDSTMARIHDTFRQ